MIHHAVPAHFILVGLGGLLLAGCFVDRAGTRVDDAGAPDAADIDAGARDASTMDGSTRDATLDDSGSDAAIPPMDDGGVTDAGPEDLFDLDWGAPVALTTTVDSARCETDPIVTSDLRWLYLTRQEDMGDGCYTRRRFHLFEWNAGNPVYVGILPRFDATVDESNAHPMDGALVGRPARVVFFHQVNGAGPTSIRHIDLSGFEPRTPEGSPTTVTSIVGTGGENGPSLTVDGTRMFFSRNDDLYEATGTPPDGWSTPRRLDSISTADTEYDPGISADGRVLVFIHRGTDGDLDVWVARRRDPGDDFSPATELPAPINSAEAEMDSFLTSNGDLLFVSARGDGVSRRVYMAPRIAP